MSTFVKCDKIDLVIPTDKVISSTFITPTRFYKIEHIITKQEIDDSVILNE